MSEPARILLVDDDESIRQTISMALKHAGYLVDSAETGKEAIQKAEERFYNLALIDVRLPDMEGTELLSSFKETTPRMVKVILTGYPALQNAVRAINKGVDAYLIKPVNTDELLAFIEQQLGKQQQEKEYGEKKLTQFLETRLKQLATDELTTKDSTKE